jgi:hypothetical protein
VIDYFGHLIKNYKFWGHFYHGQVFSIIETKNGLGFILGDFFTNLSGHSGRGPQL